MPCVKNCGPGGSSRSHRGRASPRLGVPPLCERCACEVVSPATSLSERSPRVTAKCTADTAVARGRGCISPLSHPYSRDSLAACGRRVAKRQTWERIPPPLRARTDSRTSRRRRYSPISIAMMDWITPPNVCMNACMAILLLSAAAGAGGDAGSDEMTDSGGKRLLSLER